MVAETDNDIPTSALLDFSAVNPDDGVVYFATNATDTNIYSYNGSSWSTVSGATSGACRGLVIANDYLFRARVSGGNVVVDRYGPHLALLLGVIVGEQFVRQKHQQESQPYTDKMG